MPDTSDGKEWGCITLPWVGEVCASNIGEKVQEWGESLMENGAPNGNGNGTQNGRVSSPRVTASGCPPVVVPIRVIPRAQVPRGYVVVIDPATNQKVGMLKSVARHCKLWKPARKPPISASDWRCLQKANSTVKKLDRVVKMSNKITGKASLTRSRSKR